MTRQAGKTIYHWREGERRRKGVFFAEIERPQLLILQHVRKRRRDREIAIKIATDFNHQSEGEMGLFFLRLDPTPFQDRWPCVEKDMKRTWPIFEEMASSFLWWRPAVVTTTSSSLPCILHPDLHFLRPHFCNLSSAPTIFHFSALPTFFPRPNRIGQRLRKKKEKPGKMWKTQKCYGSLVHVFKRHGGLVRTSSPLVF